MICKLYSYWRTTIKLRSIRFYLIDGNFMVVLQYEYNLHIIIRFYLIDRNFMVVLQYDYNLHIIYIRRTPKSLIWIFCTFIYFAYSLGNSPVQFVIWLSLPRNQWPGYTTVIQFSAYIESSNSLVPCTHDKSTTVCKFNSVYSSGHSPVLCAKFSRKGFRVGFAKHSPH